jgi:ATP-dependent RNA circularization protein (DNA/RNA ligase family)
VFAVLAGATILAERRDAMKIGDWELNEHELEQLAESRRQLNELFEQKDKVSNGAKALQEFRDLFDSDEEMEEFGLFLQRLREEERARFRD